MTSVRCGCDSTRRAREASADREGVVSEDEGSVAVVDDEPQLQEDPAFHEDEEPQDGPEFEPQGGFDSVDETTAEEEEAAIALTFEVTGDSLQLFLKDIGKVSLLTAAQEVELAKRIERGDHGAKQAMVE